MIPIILLSLPVLAFIGLGIYCAIYNWKHGIQVGNER